MGIEPGTTRPHENVYRSFHYGDTDSQRAGALDGYGHYEDEMVKVNGKWLFSKRKIYNEGVEKWIAPPKNPAW